MIYLQVKFQGKTPLNNEQTLLTIKDRNVEQVMLMEG
jgi:hypothetical protein